MHSIALYLYKYIRPVLIVALLISLGFSKGSISGKVKFLGKPVANVTVELFLNGALVMEKKTNSWGIFVFWNIKNGFYDLRIRRSGYNVLWKRNIQIKGRLIPSEIEFPDLNLTVKKKPDWQKQRQKYKPKYNNDRKPEIVGEIKDKMLGIVNTSRNVYMSLFVLTSLITMMSVGNLYIIITKFITDG